MGFTVTTDEERRYRAELAARIRRRRKYLGLNLREFAARASMSDSQIHKYEAGLATPTAFTLLRLAKALGVDPGWLLCGDDEIRISGSEIKIELQR